MTGILSPVLAGIVAPGLLTAAAGGDPIRLSVLDNNGALLGPGAACNTQTDSIQLTTPAGISIGGNRITGLGANNQDANAREINSIAFGNNASTSTAAVGAVAIGRGARVSAANSVAIGAGSSASRGATIGSSGEFSVGSTGATRQITNVAAGTAATDAANVGQVANAIAGFVEYDTASGVRTNSITLSGGAAGTVAVKNVTAAALTADSTDAVNGGQLFTTNTQVTTNTSSIATNTSSITALNNGTAGLVQQVGGTPGAGTITIGAATSGNRIDVSGLTGTRVVSGVSAGVADTDAVNVAQLASLGTTVSNSVQYDTVGGVRTNTVTLAGGAAGPVTVANVGAGAVTAASTDAVNGAQLFATNTQVATNTTNIAGNTTAITNLETSINNGSTGLVQQTGGAPGNGQITVGATTGGTSVSVAGTGGDRVVTGVANGLAANDAATVGQLGQVTGGAFNAVNYDTDANGGRLNTITLAGGTAGPVGISNVADGLVAAGSTAAVTGNQLAATNANVASNTTAITNNTTAIANNTTTINAVVNGQAGAFRSNNTANAAAPVATGANATAGGFGASATALRSVALGNGASSTGVNSVSLGAGSSDGGVANVVSVGSVGSERRITNVGPALNGTDAVNLSQLQAAQASFGATAGGLQSQINDINYDLGKAKRDSRAATAGAMAVAALPQAFSPGAGMIGGGVGNWRGEYAFAIGASKIIGDQTVVKAGVSYNTRGTGGFNAGVGYQF